MIDHPREWMRLALCAIGGMPPEAWTERPEGKIWGATSDHRAAIRICKRCPVRVQCLEYAMAFEDNEGRSGRDNIYGAMTPNQRHQLAKQRQKKGRTA